MVDVEWVHCSFAICAQKAVLPVALTFGTAPKETTRLNEWFAEYILKA
jgi:hypothetical protein